MGSNLNSKRRLEFLEFQDKTKTKKTKNKKTERMGRQELDRKNYRSDQTQMGWVVAEKAGVMILNVNKNESLFLLMKMNQF
jgi:hypothetical protein